MFKPKHLRLTVAFLGVVLGNWAHAQDAPSLEQAQTECQNIAQQQTGYNPNAAAATTTQPQTGGRARGAATGALVGAAKGKSKSNQYDNVPDDVAEEYTRNQMQDAAKMGAVAGASRQRQQRRQTAAAQQQQDSAANAYNQAFNSCMTAKGFPVGQ